MALGALKVVQATERVRRKGRYPVHNHLVEYKPWQIMPFMIAPVLAGETLKNLQLQGRVISDPLVAGPGNILPWWCETYYYYVKLRQLTNRAEVEAMMLEGAALTPDAADAAFYHAGGSPNWLKLCYDFVVEKGGFRDDGEAADVATIGDYHAAAAIRHGQNWADSLMPADDPDPGETVLPDANDLQNPHALGGVLAAYQEQYEAMRAMRLVDMTFEDWLKSYGVNLPEAAKFERPELIRMVSDWAYPANTVNPETGTASGVASWSQSERADKDRFFPEPGFIIGLQVVRPKVYMGNQAGSAVSILNDALTWMPRALADQPHVSVKAFLGGASGVGPLGDSQTNGYWVDARDLFLYGDQFVKMADTAGFAPALPTAAGEKRFATEAMANALFSGDAKQIRAEGVTRLYILGHPTTSTDMT